MRNKYYCVHARFDLPPWENPWLEDAEPDAAAAPYRDSIERFHHECLGPNSASPLLDEDGRILDLLNNYSRVSFDIAPALLDWLERRAPRVYARVLEADRRSLEALGHGNALAAPYPPLLLSSASAKDKRTAVDWGIADFRRRFERRPEGFSLPDSAVDEDTLEILIDRGVRFVLLDPSQALRVRKVGGKDSDWLEVGPETVGTTRPFRWMSRGKGREGAHIAVFFFRRDLSPERIYSKLPSARSAKAPLRAAREQVVDVGRRFANRLVDAFRTNNAVELSHTALDGALFGSRRLHGNRALTFALDELERDAPASPANYGAFLDLFPAPEEVGLKLPSSAGRTEEASWAAPLRGALNGLAEELDGKFQRDGAPLLRDPARARDAYGEFAFKGDARSLQPFLDAHGAKNFSPEEARDAIRLLEAQRWRLKALAHWTWKGKSLSDPSPLHALGCAARALDALSDAEGAPAAGEPEAPRGPMEERFVSELRKVPGGRAYADGSSVYARLVLPFRPELSRAAAHFAVADHLERGPVPCAEPEAAGAAFEAVVSPLCRRAFRLRRRMSSLSVARVSLRRRRTFERIDALTAVLHTGGAEIECWVLADPPPESYGREAAALDDAALRGGAKAVRTEAARIFGEGSFSLDALFPTARRAALVRLKPRGTAEKRAFLSEWQSLVERLRVDPAAAERAARLLAEAPDGLSADALPGARSLREAAARAARRFEDSPGPASIEPLAALLEAAEAAGLHLSLWELQDPVWRGLRAWTPDSHVEKRARLAELLGLSEGVFLSPPEPAGRAV